MRTPQKVLLVLMGAIVLFSLARTVWTGYGVLVGEESLRLFTESLAVFVMGFTMTLLAFEIADRGGLGA